MSSSIKQKQKMDPPKYKPTKYNYIRENTITGKYYGLKSYRANDKRKQVTSIHENLLTCAQVLNSKCKQTNIPIANLQAGFFLLQNINQQNIITLEKTLLLANIMV